MTWLQFNQGAGVRGEPPSGGSVPRDAAGPPQGVEREGEPDENLIVEGENLAALKALLPTYQGKVKCIYIDPPYS